MWALLLIAGGGGHISGGGGSGLRRNMSYDCIQNEEMFFMFSMLLRFNSSMRALLLAIWEKI